MLAGFLTIGWGIYRAFESPTDSITPALISTAAGVITEFIGATFLLMFRSVNQQASSYFKTLERINSARMAWRILQTMPDETKGDDLKSQTTAALVQLLLAQPHEVPEETGRNSKVSISKP